MSIAKFAIEVINVKPEANNTFEALGISDERVHELKRIVMQSLLGQPTKSASFAEMSRHCNSANELVAALMLTTALIRGPL